MNETVNAFLAGAIIMGALVIALFFLRYWKATHDRFFLYFALFFAIEAGDRTLLTFMYSMQEDKPIPYLIRLAAYGLIIYAIWEKNRRPATVRHPVPPA